MPESLDVKQLRSDLEKAGQPWAINPDNPIMQLTEEQRSHLLGFTPPPGETTLEEAVALDEKAEQVTYEMIAAEAVIGAPASFDHRNVAGKNYTTPVKNQGGCGSCVAFGTCAVMETTYKRAYNTTADLDLSEAHLFYCHGGEEGRNCSNGWWPEKALDKAKSQGVTLESVYQYTGNQQACAVPNGWESNCAKVTGKTKINGRTAIKEWIATRGSVTGCFIVYQDFFNYSSGVYRHVSGDQSGGHCVEIIGYSDPQGCWICKNSWGTGWGDNGYFKIAYGQCQIETWAGPYGVNAVTLRQWLNHKKVNGLWTNEAERNAWVHLQGEGWHRLTNTSVTQQHAMLTEMIGAKAAERNVNALVDTKRIIEAYVV